MGRLQLVTMLAALAGLVSSAQTTDGATSAADVATVGMLYDSEHGRLLAKTLAKWDGDVTMTSGSDCKEQMARLRRSGIRRFVSLCKSSVPVAESEEVTMVTPGVCAPSQSGCVSVKLPARSQWRALAMVMQQLGLTRTVLVEGVPDETALKEVMAENSISVEGLPTAEKLNWSEFPSNETMVILANFSMLAPTLKRFSGAQFLHWFAPEAEGPEVSAQLESPEMEELLGSAHLYTVQPGVAPSAALPVVPAGGSFSTTALAVDAITVARGTAPAQGVTGNISVSTEGVRASGHADVLMWRPQQQVVNTKAAAVHADGWLPIASVRNNTLVPPSVHYVLPVRLVSTLASPAACEAGLVTVVGTDAVSGRPYNRGFPAGDAPRALLVYGQRPFRVGLDCDGVRAEYRCYTGTRSVSCLRRVNVLTSNSTRGTTENDAGNEDNIEAAIVKEDKPMLHSNGESITEGLRPEENKNEVLSRTEREAVPPSPHGGRQRSPRRYLVDRSGRAGYRTQANKLSPSGPLKSFDQYRAVNAASGFNDAAAKKSDRVGGFADVPDNLAVASGAHATRVSPGGSNSFHQRSEFPAPVGFQPHSPGRRQDNFLYDTGLITSDDRIDGTIVPPLLPDLFGCAGVVTGCGFCIAYYSAGNTTSPESCVAPCSIVIGGACSTVVGVLIKTLAE